MDWEYLTADLARRAKREHPDLEQYTLQFHDNGESVCVRAMQDGREVACDSRKQQFNNAIASLASSL